MASLYSHQPIVRPVNNGSLPVILLHGLFGDGMNLRLLAKNLNNTTCIPVDLLNHGNSPSRSHSSYEDYLDDFMTTLKPFLPALFIGHSLGAKFAMHFCANYPEHTLGLVSLDMINRNYNHPETSALFSAMRELSASTITQRGQALNQLALTITDSRVRNFLAKNLHKAKNESAYRLRVNVDNLEHDQKNMIVEIPLPTYTKPTLFLMGEYGYQQADDLDYIEKYHPQAQLEIVPAAGHWLHGDAPNLVIEKLQSFINLSIMSKRGGSSVGRVSRSQCEGREFDPPPLHQEQKYT